MRLHGRVRSLERGAAPGGRCRCPGGTVVVTVQGDGPAPAHPGRCLRCGRDRLLMIFRYTDWTPGCGEPRPRGMLDYD